MNRALRIVRPLYFQSKSMKMSDHSTPHVFRDPKNPRKKNEWDLPNEEIHPEKSDVIIAEAMGAFLWFFILVSAYNDKGKAFVS